MGGGQQHGHARGAGPLRVPAQLGCVGRRRRARAAGRLRDAHPAVAVAGPRLRNPDGTLQRSVRGFPTLWRPGDGVPVPPQARAALAAAERVLRRRLRPRPHERGRVASRGGLLVRREAADAVGLFDEDFFMFSEETDWLPVPPGGLGGAVRRRRPRSCTSAAPRTAAGSTSRTSAGILRFLAKHRGLREAERARRLLLVALRLRAAASSAASAARAIATAPASSPPATSGRCSRDRRLPPSRVRRPPSCSCRGADRACARAGGRPSATLALALPPCSQPGRVVFTVHGDDLARALGARAAPSALPRSAPACAGGPVPRPAAGGGCSSSLGGLGLGMALWHVAGVVSGDGLFHLARVRKLVELGDLHLRTVDEFKDGGLHPGYAFPLWHGFDALVAKVSGLDPGSSSTTKRRVLVPLACLLAWESGVAVFGSAAAGAPCSRRSSASTSSRRVTAARTPRSRCLRPLETAARARGRRALLLVPRDAVLGGRAALAAAFGELRSSTRRTRSSRSSRSERSRCSGSPTGALGVGARGCRSSRARRAPLAAAACEREPRPQPRHPPRLPRACRSTEGAPDLVPPSLPDRAGAGHPRRAGRRRRAAAPAVGGARLPAALGHVRPGRLARAVRTAARARRSSCTSPTSSRSRSRGAPRGSCPSRSPSRVDWRSSPDHSPCCRSRSSRASCSSGAGRATSPTARRAARRRSSPGSRSPAPAGARRRAGGLPAWWIGERHGRAAVAAMLFVLPIAVHAARHWTPLTPVDAKALPPSLLRELRSVPARAVIIAPRR